jgi:hypothetical protein
MFDFRVLRRIFGPKRVEATRGWRKLHNEGFHSLTSSPNIIRMFKSRGVRRKGYTDSMDRRETLIKF